MQPQGEVTGTYEVQIMGAMGKVNAFEGDIDGPITIQTVLERSGATKKFRNVDVTLVRKVKESGRELRLPCDYQTRSKRVLPEQDYAIHPGDVIFIQASTRNPLDKIVDAISAK